MPDTQTIVKACLRYISEATQHLPAADYEAVLEEITDDLEARLEALQ